MIQNLTFGILFLKILIQAYKFFIFVRLFQWALSEIFLISDFLRESLKANKNQRKKSLILQYSFSQKTSLISRISTNLTLTTNCSRNTAKTLLDFTNFPASMFLFGIRNNICTGSLPDAQKPHSWNTLKLNVCIFLYISVLKFLFQRRSKILSGEGWVGGRLKSVLKAARCLDLVKCFKIFHFNWKSI